MEIFNFVEKYFELLKTFQGWSLILFGVVGGLMIYHTLNNGELRELQLKEERLAAISQQLNLTGEELSPLQRKFLKALAEYQATQNLNKVVIGKDGRLFDDTRKESLDKNVIELFLNKDTQTFLESDLEKLIYSIPEKYLRLIPETRYGSPFVLTVTE